MTEIELDIEIRKHKHIVFGFDHYNTLGAVRSLGERGIKPVAIIRDTTGGSPVLVPNSKYLAKIHIVKTAKEGYDILMKHYSHEEFKPFIYSCDDFVESCLDQHYNDLKDIFFFFNGGEPDIITRYMDKDSISQLAKECGCRVPKGEVLKKGDLPQSISYPVITKSIKSIIGGWKNDVFICNTEQELIEAYKKIKSDELLVEEFIEKKNELCLDGFSLNHGKKVFIPFQTTYIRVADGKYGNYMTLEPFNNKEVYIQVRNILQKAKFTGIFSVEFLIDKNDDLWFLEVNFRNSTWSYAFTFGGVNMLYEWALGTIGGVEFCAKKARTTSFTAMAEVNDFKDFVLTKKVSLWKWLRDVHSTDCFYFYNKHDKKPFWCYVVKHVKLFLKRK